jgi:hypothetical protein
MEDAQKELFAVYGVAEGHDKPLLMLHLPFARLMDEIVVPYMADTPFFVDGVPTKRSGLKRIKILQEQNALRRAVAYLHQDVNRAERRKERISVTQYQLRLETCLRDHAEDVTSQVIQAFDRTIKPRLRDYLPNREELIGAALKVFIDSMKLLGGS